MASPETSRLAPQKSLNNYIATIKRLQAGQVPSSVSDASFISSNYTSSGASTTATMFTTLLPIGFSIKFNGNPTSYTHFALSETGFLYLSNESNVSPSTFTTTSYTANTALRSTFIKDYIHIAPWWDVSAQVLSTIEALAASTEYNGTITTSAQINSIKNGSDTRNWPFNATDRGVRYRNFYDARHGQGLCVRWTISQVNFLNKLKFEFVLFESGRMEFRYWPLETFQPGDSAGTNSTATVGIFWNGTPIGSNQFRDFAPLLGYSNQFRVLNELGGAAYDPAYSESAVNYSNLITQNYWPGPAIITFSPPSNSARFLPRKLAKNIGNSKEIVRPPGLFDDRKSIFFATGSTQVVHMPSTLSSRLINDVGEQPSLINVLFTSGSLQLTGSQNKDVIEGLLQSLELDETSKNSFNFSFNEAEKNYLETSSNSSFYATGSSLELFGEGFDQPLKSKQQIKISLPVERTSLMPAISSSIYYYDVVRKQWTSAIPYDWEQPSGLEAESAGPMGGPTNSTFLRDFPILIGGGFAGIPSDTYYSGRSYLLATVTETSHGFDAVGRKVVMGGTKPGQSAADNSGQGSPGYRSSDFIGNTINVTSRPASYLGNAVESKYSRSLTDNAVYFPSSSQLISVNTDLPFILEKIAVDIPLYISGGWFQDLTTCNKPYLTGATAGTQLLWNGLVSGVLDFGGPGITFSIMKPTRGLGNSYMDIIASGTITHQFDDKADVAFYKDSYMRSHVLRPIGFRSFSNPSTVISGTWNGTGYEYTGKVHLELEPAIAGGLCYAKVNAITGTVGASQNLARQLTLSLLTSQSVPTLGSQSINPFVGYSNNNDKEDVYIQQISPLSRGQTGVEFNGRSVLGKSIAGFSNDGQIKNPLYIGPSASLPSSIKSIVDSDFNVVAISSYSTIDSQISPYLLLPGDKLTFSISKTRPVLNIANSIGEGDEQPGVLEYVYWVYGDYILTGSHDIVQLNTGSVDITLYGSYIREGAAYNP